MQPKGTTTVKHAILHVVTLAVVVTALGALAGSALAQNPRGSAEGPTKARGYARGLFTERRARERCKPC